jgi:DNA-directed RNA polymerase delta subunit
MMFCELYKQSQVKWRTTKYNTIETVPTFYSKIVEETKSIPLGGNIYTWPINLLSWYKHLKKSGGVKLIVWA